MAGYYFKFNLMAIGVKVISLFKASFDVKRPNGFNNQNLN